MPGITPKIQSKTFIQKSVEKKPRLINGTMGGTNVSKNECGGLSLNERCLKLPVISKT